MEDFNKKPPGELEEIAQMRRGRDFSKVREKMLKETEEGVNELLKKDSADSKEENPEK